MIILMIMIIGVIIGTLVFPERWHSYNNKVQVLSIIVLIFCMGATLGSNKDFMHSLLEIGFKGFVFAIIPIILSVGVVYILTKHLMKEKKDD